ncbi:MAG: hypothetical protein KJ077_48965, partial [Anaerolineae bacterium]|nr:hypothetical protein [Anaerolineae bacterium]
CKVDPKSRIKPETLPLTEVAATDEAEQNGKTNGKAGKVKGWEPATIRQALIVIRCFLHWCYEENCISKDLAQALQIPKNKRRIQRTLNGDEIQALLERATLQRSKGYEMQPWYPYLPIRAYDQLRCGSSP